MKAIDTQYAGCLFRSRLEARWAVFFDALGEPWEYEKEGFELPCGDRYLPDFWLPNFGCWLEIKGQAPTPWEEHLCEQLAEETDKPVVMAWGLPGNGMKVFCLVTGGDGWGTEWIENCTFAVDKEGKLCICMNQVWENRFFSSPGWDNEFSRLKQLPEIKAAISEIYVNAAKSARFEFGQTPVVRR